MSNSIRLAAVIGASAGLVLYCWPIALIFWVIGIIAETLIQVLFHLPAAGFGWVLLAEYILLVIIMFIATKKMEDRRKIYKKCNREVCSAKH